MKDLILILKFIKSKKKIISVFFPTMILAGPLAHKIVFQIIRDDKYKIFGGDIRNRKKGLIFGLGGTPYWKWIPATDVYHWKIINLPNDNIQIQADQFIWKGHCLGVKGYKMVLKLCSYLSDEDLSVILSILDIRVEDDVCDGGAVEPMIYS